MDMFGLNQRRTLVQAHISDLHFGAMEPQLQYKILEEQYIAELEKLPTLDIVAIDGDVFHHKAMGNSDIIMYAGIFAHALIDRVIRPRNATLVLVYGTSSHDADQFKIFYQYLNDPTIDIRIVDNICFQDIKGARVLCIPDKAGVPEEVYNEFLFESGWYDTVFMHGTVKGAVMGDNPGANCHLFTEQDFQNCLGPIIAGHVHTGGCFFQNFYYCGSPYAWQFGEEEPKGFLIVLHNLNNSSHFVFKQRIESFRYITITLDDIIDRDPREIISYIDKVKVEQNIDFIRIKFQKEVPTNTKAILDNFYRQNKEVKLKYDYTTEKRIIENNLKESEDLQKYAYIYDKSLNEYDKLAIYINDSMGYEYTTGDRIKAFYEKEAALL